MHRMPFRSLEGNMRISMPRCNQSICHNAYWLHLILEHAMKTLVSTMLTIYIVMQKENANGMLKKEKRKERVYFSNVKLHKVLTSSRLTKPATLPPLAQMDSTTLRTLLFTLHLVLPSTSRACMFRTKLA
jgi:uncharacterized UBP type Zn finger protein